MHVKENLLTESIPFLKKDLWLHVVSVKYLDNYQLKLTFNNGIEGIVDLEQELYGEIFEPLKDKSLFQKVFINSRTIEWPNGADFAPEFLWEIAAFQEAQKLSDTLQDELAQQLLSDLDNELKWQKTLSDPDSDLDILRQMAEAALNEDQEKTTEEKGFGEE